MAVNKVSFNTASGEEVLIDLTNDTVTPETLAEGVTAHGANGEPIVGTMRSGEDLDAVLAEQEELIAELKEVLAEKAAGGGAVLPELTNPASAWDIVIGKQAIDGEGNVIDGVINVEDDDISSGDCALFQSENGIWMECGMEEDVLIRAGLNFALCRPASDFGDAAPEDVTAGKTFTSAAGLAVVGTATASGGGGDLPAGYSRVDYIQFNGSSWVDTGVIGNQDTQINAHFTWEYSTQRHLFGCASSDNTASITSYMNGSWRFGNKSTSKSLSNKNPMLPYSALVNKTTISITNSITSISDVNDFETVGTLLLGGCRDADGTQPGVGITGKVYRFLLWQGDQLVRNLVPVTDGTVFRFYDTVSGAFFDSITSTPLSGGNL